MVDGLPEVRSVARCPHRQLDSSRRAVSFLKDPSVFLPRQPLSGRALTEVSLSMMGRWHTKLITLQNMNDRITISQTPERREQNAFGGSAGKGTPLRAHMPSWRAWKGHKNQSQERLEQNKMSSGHLCSCELTAAVVSPAQNLHKVNLINAIAWCGKQLRRLYPSVRNIDSWWPLKEGELFALSMWLLVGWPHSNGWSYTQG